MDTALKTKRRVRRVIGQLAPERLYTVEGCMRFAGLGEESLAEGRQAGYLHPTYKGRRAHYQGHELIQFILETGSKSVPGRTAK